MKRQNVLLRGCLIIGLIVSQMPVVRADLGGYIDGRTTPIYYDTHQTFTGWSKVLGRVQFMDGFTVNPGVEVQMNISEPVMGASGGQTKIDLSTTGILTLLSNMSVNVGYFYGGIIKIGVPSVELKFTFPTNMLGAINIQSGVGNAIYINLNSQSIFFRQFSDPADGWTKSRGFVIGTDNTYCVLLNGALQFCGDRTVSGNIYPILRSSAPGTDRYFAFNALDLYLDNNMTLTTCNHLRVEDNTNLYTVHTNGYTFTVGGGSADIQAALFPGAITANDDMTLAFDSLQPPASGPELLKYIFNNGNFTTNADYSFARAGFKISGVSHFQTSRPGRKVSFGTGAAGFDTNLLVNPGSKLVVDDGVVLEYKNIN